MINPDLNAKAINVYDPNRIIKLTKSTIMT